jgi:hypothetical protein
MPTPIAVELLPDRLHAVVFTHEVTVRGVTHPCRTCVSRGMASRKRRELVVTRVAPPADGVVDADVEVFNFFARLFDAPDDGAVAGVGLVTAFEVPFLGAGAPNAVTFVEAEPFPDVTVDPDALAVVVLHPDEAPVALKYGAARVLARLGRQAGYHPFPRWWDPSRASVAHPDDDEKSTLAGVVRVALPEGTLASIDRTVVLRLPAETRAGLTKVLDSRPTRPARCSSPRRPSPTRRWCGRPARTPSPRPRPPGAATGSAATSCSSPRGSRGTTASSTRTASRCCCAPRPGAPCAAPCATAAA